METQLDINPPSNERYYLEKLAQCLNFHLSTGILFFLSFFWTIGLILIIIAAVIFTPIMLYLILKGGKASWLFSFIICVIVPLIISIILGLEFNYLSVFLLIGLLFFYFYFFVLRFVVNDQLSEVIAKEELQREREGERNNELQH
jgi:Mn2+/Fe2+ NRAMP family transporter